jgi:hypothetical protein
MDNNTQKDCELSLCDGSGILLKANGPDDFDEDFCLCEKGEKLQDTGRAEAYDQHERFDLTKFTNEFFGNIYRSHRLL